MRKLTRVALSATIAAALLAACGTLPTSLSDNQYAAHGASAQKRATSSYQVIYRFDGHPNGEEPVAGLTDVNGVLYGTTSMGGMKDCPRKYGCGTLYSITPSGSESLVLAFNEQRGVFPLSGLLNVNGTLYGTTNVGGGDRLGTVYSVSTSGSETVLHSFAGRSDGGQPVAGVIDVKGTLYGTTPDGGMKHVALAERTSSPPPVGDICCGTVYTISASGVHAVLYRFKGGSDGSTPQSGLLDVRGTLYGTTSYGGGASGCSGCGTVYSIGTKGVEKVLWRFSGSPDGEYPFGDLLSVNGVLYGTTILGGSSGNCYHGCGTVYTITTAGEEKVLYSFAGGSDGARPNAGLIDVNGTLYGTTAQGGDTSCKYSGCGTVFSVTPSGTETVLYAFAGGTDGLSPQAPLRDVNGTLYGTTRFGGTPRPKPTNCCGTVFALTP